MEPPATVDTPDDKGARRRRLGMAAVLVVAIALASGWLLNVVMNDDSVPGERSATPVSPGAASDGEAVIRIKELSELPGGPVDHVEVAYFHRTQRCHSCIEAERLTRKTLDTYFAADMDRGDLSLVIADVEAPENAGRAALYDAWTSSLYLGVTKGGVLYSYGVADMWFNIGDEDRFVDSLRSKLETILGTT